MSRIVLACALLALTPALAGGAPEGHDQKHSGVIVDVAPEQRTITVDELGPWTAGAPDRVWSRASSRIAGSWPRGARRRSSGAIPASR